MSRQHGRRDFLMKGSCCLMALGLGCSRQEQPVSRIVALGPPEKFAPGLTALEIERIAVLRDARGIAAVSLVCTHQVCQLTVESGSNGFLCPCHGSRFTVEGAILTGPAKQPLPWFKLQLNQRGIVEADLGSVVTSEWRLQLPV
ncbi:MAG: ubiquinol-cytochrome c reductase iron-sulfur subunit [Deltaproteobacteria bacterium]|nr:ubiquinol-cytochrome c reductase iron-sulfur subunit [Deltaproteobacteria bacterium]